VSATEEEFSDTNKEICEELFREKEYFTMKDFLDFRQKLKTALRHYEFH
jgi:hypothetical protein